MASTPNSRTEALDAVFANISLDRAAGKAARDGRAWRVAPRTFHVPLCNLS
jgi:hypothetical protein